jgi:hypothetical protein
MREHWVAASGGLVSLAWPWGGKADAARVVADPFTRSEAMAAASMDEGRSPFLVRHVLGNVAEALSADGLALHAGGGSFADDARALAMDGSKRETLRTPLLSVFAPSPAVGTRLHRFVPNDEAGSHAARTRALREELERSPRAFPTLRIDPKVDSVEGCTFGDLTIEGYNPYGKIKMDMAV